MTTFLDYECYFGLQKTLFEKKVAWHAMYKCTYINTFTILKDFRSLYEVEGGECGGWGAGIPLKEIGFCGRLNKINWFGFHYNKFRLNIQYRVRGKSSLRRCGRSSYISCNHRLRRRRLLAHGSCWFCSDLHGCSSCYLSCNHRLRRRRLLVCGSCRYC